MLTLTSGQSGFGTRERGSLLSGQAGIARLRLGSVEDRFDRPELRISDADRHRVAEFLRVAAGDGRLTVEELGERLDRALTAKTYGDLEELTSDLPNSDKPLVPIRESVSGRLANVSGRSAAELVGGTPSDSNTSIAVFGSTKRSGRWVVPAVYQAFAMYGSVELDLREAMFERTETTIYANCLFGSIVVIVPDDIVTHVVGLPLFGGFGESQREDFDPPPDNAPLVRVKGVAMFGTVDVQRRRRRTQRRRMGRT